MLKINYRKDNILRQIYIYMYESDKRGGKFSGLESEIFGIKIVFRLNRLLLYFDQVIII